MSFIEFMRWLALVVFGGAATGSLVSFHRHYPLNLKRLSLLWVTLFLIDVVGNILRKLDIDNLWLYNIFYWIWFPSLAYLYYQQLESKTVTRIISVYLIIFPFFVLVDSLFLEGVKGSQSLVVVLGGGFVTFLAAAYFRQLYLSEENRSITTDPWFWFSFGFIVFFAGAFVPYLGMLNYLVDRFGQFASEYYSYVYLWFTILLHILILTGFLCRTRYRKSY